MLRRALLVATALLLIVPAGTAVASGPTSLGLPDQAARPDTFSLPDQASEVAKGVFFLGYTVEDGVELVGYAYARRADAKPKDKPGKGGGGGGGGGTVDPASCYSYIANGSAWVNTESYLLNPANSTIGTITAGAADGAFGSWESAAGGASIVNNGTETSAGLSADTSSTDGRNEIYFAGIADKGVLGYTIVWSTRSRGPFRGQIVEADMVIDDAGWDWYVGSETGNIGNNQIDFWGVFTHEAGHWVGMGHTDTVSACTGQTMYPSVSSGDASKQSLGDGDKAGVRGLYS